MRSSLKFIMAGVSMLSLAAPAYAQDAEAEEEEPIVVTGTLIRGIAPAGVNVVGVSAKAIEESGASTTSQLLQTIPQGNAFNNLLTPVGGGNFVTTNRPNLRNMPGFTTTGSSATLMLVDGHRVVGLGISSTSPDADLVPPGIIERVEILPDGGSAIYGSDAVAGVINFITRKDFKGVKVDGHYGFADNYKTYDANITAGHSWDGGNTYISYNYSTHDALYGRDRDFVKMFPAISSGLSTPFTSLECNPGNAYVRLSADAYGLPFTNATAASRKNVLNQCDLSDNATFYPDETRHSVFAGLNQQLNDTLSFDVRAFYMKRDQYSSQGNRHTTTLLANQTFIPGVTYTPFMATHAIQGGFVELQNVAYAWGGNEELHQNINLSTWGVTPTFTAELGGGWQARALANYGESVSTSHSTSTNQNALNAALASGLFNPYDTASSDAGALAAIGDYERFGRTRQKQFQTRLIVDGDLMTLPGGAVKLAAGVEYVSSSFNSQRGDTRPGQQGTGSVAQTVTGLVNNVSKSFVVPAVSGIPIFQLSRNIKSAFGELVVPLFSDENATSAIKELTLSVSGRYDDYSDFGSTFNPKVGVTWKPADWLKFRGSWGKSFAAPSLADDSRTDPSTANWASGGTFGFLVPSAVLAANNLPTVQPGQTNMIVILGGGLNLQPSTAKTWSAGADLDVPFVPGLKLGVTYWDIKYRNIVAQAPFTNTGTYFSTYTDSFIINPTQAQINTAIAGASSVVGSACAPSPSCLYIIEDNRKANLGRYYLNGLDFTASYRTDTSFGGVDFMVSGNQDLHRKASATLTSAFREDRLSGYELKVRSSIGVDVGNFRAQGTWTHSGGWTLDTPNPAAGALPAQLSVGAYNVFDLFFKYDFDGEGMMKDLSLTLNVNNVTDQDPPFFTGQQITASTNGYTNGSTVGRLVQFGISKRF